MKYFKKNIRLILILLILFNFFYSRGYSQWVNQYVPFLYFSSTYVFCVNENTVFISGTESIIKTTNGGLNWTSASFPSNSIRSMYFPNNTTGWAAGGTYAGFLIKTTNGGSNWNAIINGYSKFNCVYFRNINTGFIAGEGGLVLKTTNGGINWQDLSVGAVSNFSSINFLNDYTGWVIGNGGSIFRTTNGGINWIGQPSGTMHYLKKISIINQDTSYIAGAGNFSQGIFLATYNIGVNWINLAPDSLPALYSLYFINSNTGWIAGYGNNIRRTSNGGTNWINQPLYYFQPIIYSICFCNSYVGWAVGSQIFKTTNGGSVFIKRIETVTPDKYYLYQNYPNPFNPVTKIKFEIPSGFPLEARGNDRVVLKVFDMLGKEITTLVNEQLQPGTYEVTFDAGNLASGIYFYKLETGKFVETKKMVLLK